MLRLPVKILLFLSSYIPLYILLIVRNYENATLSWGLALFSIVIGTLLFLALSRIFNRGGEYKEMKEVEDSNKVNLEYFVVYIIPFLTQDFLKLQDSISFVIVFFIIGVIYIKSDLVYINPVLTLAGYNIFKARIDGGEKIVILHKKKAELESTEKVIEIGDNVFLGRQKRDRGLRNQHNTEDSEIP